MGRAVREGAAAPRVVLVDAREWLSGDTADAVHASTRGALGAAQAWLAEEQLTTCRLAVVTAGAVGVRAEEELPGLARRGCGVWCASAQAENPGRFALVDVDGAGASWEALHGALLAAGTEEHQLAVRAGGVFVPRLAPVARAASPREGVPEGGPAVDGAEGGPVGGGGEEVSVAKAATHGAPALDVKGTVLITGGTGELGALLARHLVERPRGAHLLLTSRRGPQAPGAAELQARAGGAGREREVVACDVADREQLRTVLASVSAGAPAACGGARRGRARRRRGRLADRGAGRRGCWRRRWTARGTCTS